MKLILIKYKFTICKTNARPLNRIEITIEMFCLLTMQASKHWLESLVKYLLIFFGRKIDVKKKHFKYNKVGVD